MRWWTRPCRSSNAAARRYGRRFTVRLVATPPFVMLADPDEVKQVFTAPAEVLHPGSGARILEPVIGRNSVILLDEDAHLAQRRLMLPAFHGEQVANLTEVMAEVAATEVEGWPRASRSLCTRACRHSRSRSSCARSSAWTRERGSIACAST